MSVRLSHILLVAGPSAAGKSTFIELLQAQRLPAGILHQLPRGVDGWPLVSANFRLARLSAAMTSGVAANEGLIVHYDTTFPNRYGIGSYADDPELSFLARACPVTVANILPSYTQLVAQFQERSRSRLASKNALRRLWGRYVRIPAGRLSSLWGGPTRATGDLYATPEWLNDSCRQWSEFITCRLRDNPRSAIVDIEPWPDASGGPGFRPREVSSSLV